MFGFGLTFISTILLVYVVWRASSTPVINKTVSKRTFIYGGLLLWLLIAIGRLWGHGSDSTWASHADFIGISLTGIFFLLFICLFPVDLATGFGRFFPHMAPRLRGCALLAGCMLGIVATIQGIRPPVVTRYEVQMNNLPNELNGTTLVALSDLHLGSVLGPQWLEACIRQVEALKPDIVVLLGDTYEGHGEDTEIFAPFFKKISAPLGVWAVNGNHENHGKTENLNAFINGTQIQTLQSEMVQPTQGLVLAGRNVNRDHTRVVTSLPWNPPANRPSGALILLSHVPEDYHDAARAGVELMLSGHTHGGQVWPLSFLVGIKHAMLGGRYDIEGMTLLVSRGTGTWGPRMRLWRPGEILNITLRPKTEIHTAMDAGARN